MSPTKSNTFLGVLLVLLSSCHLNKGVNEEPIFKNNPPESTVYKNKLGELIKADDDALSYFVKGYKVQYGHDLLIVTVSGPDILATAFIQINDPKGIEQLVVNRADGYVGAELEGLKLEATKGPKGTVLLYKSVEAILD